jgi:protein subunit release factor A
LILKWHQKKLRTEKVEINKETIRTYHEQDNRVKDHLSGFTQPYTEVFNDISQMIDARHKKLLEE